MIALVRVDNRLIHGQVIEGWLPYLQVSRVLVADDAAAKNPLLRAAMSLAVPDKIGCEIMPLSGTDFAAFEASPERALLLLREVSGVARAREQHLRCAHLNLGNVHFAPGRVEVTPSVFLSAEELSLLRRLASAGVVIEARALPRDRMLALQDIVGRVEAAPEPGKG